MKVKVFVVEFVRDGKRQWYPESMSRSVAYALGRQLAKLGHKPVVRRIDLPLDRVEQLLRDYESLS